MPACCSCVGPQLAWGSGAPGHQGTKRQLAQPRCWGMGPVDSALPAQHTGVRGFSGGTWEVGPARGAA